MFGVMPILNLPVKADDWSGYDFTTGTLAERLDTIISNGISFGVSTPLPAVNGKFSSSKLYTVTFSGTGRQWKGYQCIAYAYAVYNYLFRTDTALDKNIVFSTLKGKNQLNYDILQSLGVKSGAYLRTTGNSSGKYHASNGHSVIILSYNASKINTLEAISNNGQYVVKIRSRNWEDFNNNVFSDRYVCSLLQPPDSVYEKLLGKSSNLTANLTITFDANGGTVSPSTKTIEVGALLADMPTPVRSG